MLRNEIDSNYFPWACVMRFDGRKVPNALEGPSCAWLITMTSSYGALASFTTPVALDAGYIGLAGTPRG